MIAAEFEDKDLNEIIDQTITSYQTFLFWNIIKVVGDPKVILDVYSNGYFEHETNEQFFDKEIRKILIFMNLEEQIISKNFDKKVLVNYIIDELLSKINVLISAFKKENLLMLLYQLSSYIAESHTRIFALMQRELELNNLKNIDNVLELMLVGIASNVHDGRQSLVCGILGMDKGIIQYLISLAAFKDDYHNRSMTKNSVDIIIIFKYVGLIMYLIQIRDLLTGKFIRENELVVKDFSIYLNNYIKNKIQKRNRNAYFEDLGKPDIHEDKKQMLFSNFSKIFGFNPSLLEKYIVSKNKLVSDVNLSNVISIEILELSIINDCNCSELEAKSMIDYLLFESPSSKECFYNSINDFPKRILSNSIMKIKYFDIDMYMISYPLMILNNELMKRKIFYDHIKELNGSNTKIVNKINDKLSVQLKNIFESYKIIFIANFNKYKITMDGSLKTFNLSRELDGVFVYEKVLYLIECKSIIPKFESKGFNKDIRKAREYIEIMIENKIKIQEKLQHFEILFSSKIEQIEMILIYNNYNILIDSDFDTKCVKIYTLKSFIDWFKRNKLNKA